MTFWSLTNSDFPTQSDFPPISWPWYQAWPSPTMSGFHGAFATPAGNAYPSGHLVPSPILGLANAPIVETKFLELAMSLLDFSPRIPLGTFSILLKNIDVCETLMPPFPNISRIGLTFDLLTWILIGIIYSSGTIYLPGLKLLRQTILE